MKSGRSFHRWELNGCLAELGHGTARSLHCLLPAGTSLDHLIALPLHSIEVEGGWIPVQTEAAQRNQSQSAQLCDDGTPEFPHRPLGHYRRLFGMMVVETTPSC
jgi:hypothetical protein